VGLHPVRYAVMSLLALLLLAAPVLSLRMGWADAGSEPTSTTHRRAYDLVEEGFGAGANGPLVVTLDLGDLAAREATPLIGTLAGELTHTEGVDQVIPARRNAAGDTAVLVVMPTTGPEEAATTDLVDRIRTEALPEVLDGSGASGHVTGATAALVDLSARLADRMALFIGAVVFVSFLLLVVLFRSLLVPLKAALMNLLSIGAAYGVLVAVFQWGWGASLFGLDGPVPVTSFIPVMVFAIVFGLSMDYEVFLLSRVREEYDRTGDAHQSVVEGLGATARVITSAALVMIAVFVAFGMSPNTAIKMMGIGLATAVLVDATVIRMVLVPASMAILGDANWWLPSWLDRLLPHLDLEGPSAGTPFPAPAEADELVVDLAPEAAPGRELEPVGAG
jgi:RND superfamily putative drug exporter